MSRNTSWYEDIEGGKIWNKSFFKHEDATLTVCQGKPSKTDLVLSSMHLNVTVRQITKKLPETVEYYNSTKTSSWRLSLQVFSNILDFVAINFLIANINKGYYIYL